MPAVRFAVDNAYHPCDLRSRLSNRAAGRACLRAFPLSTVAFLVALSLAAMRDGEEIVGTEMPPLAFDAWVNTEGDRPLDSAGRVTLYRWWTDGCPHCEKTLPAVEALRKEYPALQVVAVYHPKPPRPVTGAAVRDAAANMGYAGPIAVDGDWSELRKFYLDKADRRATSASFLVDRKGVIQHVHPGPRFYPSANAAEAAENNDYLRLKEAVEGLLNAKT
jgi:thiol-disulfide isomerase/thioredoxin